jgi:predicted HTH domain antitoxin
MPLMISDEMLEQMKLDEREARIEIACRLYDADKLPLWPAACLAGLGRGAFEDELVARGLPVYRYTEDDLDQDLRTLRTIEQDERAK